MIVSSDFRDRATGAMWAQVFRSASTRPFEIRRELYRQYINSSAWRKRRAYEIALAGHKCRECGHDGTAGIALQVHHVSYANLGEETPSDVVVLCKLCHECRHGISAITKVVNAVFGSEDPERERLRSENKRLRGHLPE